MELQFPFYYNISIFFQTTASNRRQPQLTLPGRGSYNTGKVGSVSVELNGVAAQIAADNYAGVLFGKALGEGGSSTGVTFGD